MLNVCVHADEIDASLTIKLHAETQISICSGMLTVLLLAHLLFSSSSLKPLLQAVFCCCWVVVFFHASNFNLLLQVLHIQEGRASLKVHTVLQAERNSLERVKCC